MNFPLFISHICDMFIKKNHRSNAMQQQSKLKKSSGASLLQTSCSKNSSKKGKKLTKEQNQTKKSIASCTSNKSRSSPSAKRQNDSSKSFSNGSVNKINSGRVHNNSNVLRKFKNIASDNCNGNDRIKNNAKNDAIIDLIELNFSKKLEPNYKIPKTSSSVAHPYSSTSYSTTSNSVCSLIKQSKKQIKSEADDEQKIPSINTSGYRPSVLDQAISFLKQNESSNCQIDFNQEGQKTFQNLSSDYLKVHFNSFQWVLEDNLTQIRQKKHECSIEREIFSSFFNTVSFRRNESVEIPQKLKKLWEKETKIKVMATQCSLLNLCSEEKRHFYHSILNVSEKELTIENNIAKKENDMITNWELVSLKHAFNAFPNQNLSVSHGDTSSSSTSKECQIVSEDELTIKKKSKKIRNKKNHRAQKPSQLIDQYVTMFSIEKFEKFNSFVHKIILNMNDFSLKSIRAFVRTNLELFGYTKFLLEEFCHSSINIDQSKSINSSSKENHAEELPLKRRRRSSSKALDYDPNVSKKRNQSSNSLSPSTSKPIYENQFDIPWMTRTQMKYFYQNVINENHINGTNISKDSLLNHQTFQSLVSNEYFQKLLFEIRERQLILKIFSALRGFRKSRKIIHYPSSDSQDGSWRSNKRRRRRQYDSTKSSQRRKKLIQFNNSRSESFSCEQLGCNGIECLKKFDLPSISYEDKSTRSATSSVDCSFANEENSMMTTFDFLDSSMKAIKKTSPIINTEQSNDKNHNFGKSNAKNGKMISPSKCEMTLRSRSSSNSCQESTVLPASQTPALCSQNEIKVIFSYDNTNCFKSFVEIDFSDAHDPSETDVSNNFTREKHKRLKATKRTISKLDESSQLSLSYMSSTSSSPSTSSCITNSNDFNEDLSNYTLAIKKFTSKILPKVCFNLSILKQIANLLVKDFQLNRMDSELKRLDLEILNFYYQYLYKSKNLSDTEISNILMKIEDHYCLTGNFVNQSLQIMAAAPNSQQMCSVFCERSNWSRLLINFNSSRSYHQDLFYSIVSSLGETITDDKRKFLLALNQKIDWQKFDRLDHLKHQFAKRAISVAKRKG
ncbi:hypothetical protein SSS_10292 [Sarcoptes scabiei]|uniref:Uncharacterized protein n=1 Tax=Sarcoptes scabiei TaxID=52283 RepID=A0A834RCI5_SARSC|nr:hypothetical protein SSS_10292 [Sarcoptes scabiei]